MLTRKKRNYRLPIILITATYDRVLRRRFHLDICFRSHLLEDTAAPLDSSREDMVSAALRSRYPCRTEASFLERTEEAFLARTEAAFLARTEAEFLARTEAALARMEAASEEDRYTLWFLELAS